MTGKPSTRRLLEAANTIGELARHHNAREESDKGELLLYTQTELFRTCGIGYERPPALNRELLGSAEEVESAEDIAKLAEAHDIKLSKLLVAVHERMDEEAAWLNEHGAIFSDEDIVRHLIPKGRTQEPAGVALSDSGPDPTQPTTPDEETAESDAERGREEPEESERTEIPFEEVEASSASGTPREGKKHMEFVDKGERRDEVIEFLEAHEGEWVTTRDFVEWANLDLPGGQGQEISVASSALKNAREHEWVKPLQSKLVKDDRGGHIRVYLYGEESDGEGEEDQDDQSPSGEQEIEEDESEVPSEPPETYGIEQVEELWDLLKESGEVDREMARDVVDIYLRRRADPSEEDDEEFLIEHALEDAGVPREDRIAIVDEMFPYDSDEEDEEDDEEPEDEVDGDSEEESEETAEEESEGTKAPPSTSAMPGQISQGTHEHQTLALLVELYEQSGEERVKSQEMADVGQLKKLQYQGALSALKKKNLVDMEREGHTKPGRWAPTKAGEAEIRRVGGYQINDGASA